MAKAVSESEFAPPTGDGIRRKGTGLKISYEQAMSLLGWGEGP